MSNSWYCLTFEDYREHDRLLSVAVQQELEPVVNGNELDPHEFMICVRPSLLTLWRLKYSFEAYEYTSLREVFADLEQWNGKTVNLR